MSCVGTMKETPDLEIMGDMLDDLRDDRCGQDQEPVCSTAPKASEPAFDPNDVPAWWLA